MVTYPLLPLGYGMLPGMEEPPSLVQYLSFSFGYVMAILAETTGFSTSCFTYSLTPAVLSGRNHQLKGYLIV
jgi:hypothetical protein